MTDQRTLRAALTRAEHELREAGVPNARTDAQLLAAHVLGMTRGELAAALIISTETVKNFDFEKYAHLVSERCRRTPLQHLTGTAPFRHLELAVGPGVFIPRPETEAVVQVALDEIARRDAENPEIEQIVVDLCTGSGAIALAIATESVATQVHAIEVSDLAYAWAQKNRDHVARDLGPDSVTSVRLHLGDATAPESLQDLDGLVDIVVTNPPYIPPDQVPVEQEVADHDPEIALYGRGADGLKVPAGVLNRSRNLLKPGGLLVLEHAEIQAEKLRKMAADSGWENVETRADLAGRPRMLCANTPSRHPR